MFTDVDLAGYNIATFDIPFLQAEFNRTDIDVDLGQAQVFDCYHIFKTREKSKNLDAAYEFYNHKPRPPGAHQAADDVEDTIAVFRAQVERYGLGGDLTQMLKQLNSKAPKGPRSKVTSYNGELVLNFGKYKGKSINLLTVEDPDYLEWLIKEEVIPEWREEIQIAIIEKRKEKRQ
jgi:DNA polymerase-3 subunit epsilon